MPRSPVHRDPGADQRNRPQAVGPLAARRPVWACLQSTPAKRDREPGGQRAGRLHRLEGRRQETLDSIERARREIDYARESLGQPFPQAAQIAEARERARQIDEQLDQMVAELQAADTEQSQQPESEQGDRAARSAQQSEQATAVSPGAGRRTVSTVCSPPTLGEVNQDRVAWSRPLATASPDPDPGRPPTADWRDEVIRSGMDSWMPRPLRAFEASPFRSPEHGDPEIGS
jgi:hypothetical protein